MKEGRMFAEFLLKLNDVRMVMPMAWGLWHITWVLAAVGVSVFFYVSKRRKVNIRPNLVFGLYGFITFGLELIKQLMWSVDLVDGAARWSYTWYSAPFQFCTSAMFVSIILCFVKNEKVRKYLYSFLMYFSVISMTLVMVMPGDIFTGNVLINIHTSFMHFGGFALCMFVVINEMAEYHPLNVLRGGVVFLCFVAVAMILNVAVQKSGINHGEVFNMFYISPYFPCTLPVLSEIYKMVPYPVFLLIYIVAFNVGAMAVLGIIWAFVSVGRLLNRKKRAYVHKEEV